MFYSCQPDGSEELAMRLPHGQLGQRDQQECGVVFLQTNAMTSSHLADHASAIHHSRHHSENRNAIKLLEQLPLNYLESLAHHNREVGTLHSLAKCHLAS